MVDVRQRQMELSDAAISHAVALRFRWVSAMEKLSKNGCMGVLPKHHRP